MDTDKETEASRDFHDLRSMVWKPQRCTPSNLWMDPRTQHFL